MFNQFEGIGNLSAQPEMRQANSGTEIANFTVCCDSGWGDNKRTEFVRCTAFGKLAGIVGQYGQKGMKVFVQGELQTSQYEKNGEKRYSTGIIVNTFKMLGSKSDNQGSGSQPQPSSGGSNGGAPGNNGSPEPTGGSYGGQPSTGGDVPFSPIY